MRVFLLLIYMAILTAQTFSQDLRENLIREDWILDSPAKITCLSSWWIKDVISFLNAEYILRNPENGTAVNRIKKETLLRRKVPNGSKHDEINRTERFNLENGAPRRVRWESDSIQFESNWLYDENGRVSVYSIQTVANSKVTFSETFKYSSSGEILILNASGEIDRFIEGEVDGERIVVRVYKNKRKWQTFVFDLDANYRVSEVTLTTNWAKPSTSKFVYHYDSLNRLTEFSEISEMSGKKVSDIRFVYTGDVLTQSVESIANRVTHFKEPDTHNNWQRKEEQVIGQPVRIITERYITYW